MTEIRVTNFELLRVLGGHPVVFHTVDGEEVQLRLGTVEEIMEAQAAASDTLPEDIRPPRMTREQAENLTRPVGS